MTSQNQSTSGSMNPLMVKPNKMANGGVFQSEEMFLCQLFLQSDVAFEITSKIGELGILEFRDLNSQLNAYQRKYVDEIRHIIEIQRKLIYLNEQLEKEGIHKERPKVEPIPRPREIISMETRIEELEHELRDINEHLYSLRLEEFETIEKSKILSKTNQLLETTRRTHQSNSFVGLTDFNAINEANSKQLDIETSARNSAVGMMDQCHKIFTITGLIRVDKAMAFRTIIWRVCSQNAFVQYYDLEEPIDDVRTNEFVQKKVFLVMCQGQQLYNKIKKICDGFHASQYPLPEDDEQYKKMCLKVQQDLNDIKLVIEQTRQQKFKTLMVVAKPENFQTWVIQITKLRAIFNTMNLYQKTEKGFLAEGWVAGSDYPLLCQIIQQINDNGMQGQAWVEKVHTNAIPPTYFRLNKFTQGFQNIVDSYGVATYREMNPAPYTIITFPFLFAMMFADAGHGLIMMLFALWMVLREKQLTGKSNNEIWLTFFDGRYIILLMGLFSIYTGSIYNDIFAKAYNLFGTSFQEPPPKNLSNHLAYFSEMDFDSGPWFAMKNNTDHANHTEILEDLIYLVKNNHKNCPYGIDPAWQLSSNKILFLNSFKMKLSVIVGVLQMFFGVMISLANHINQRNWTSILFEFIPQVIFLLSLFGYMIALIIAKWIKQWKPHLAPSILIDFINMFLMKYPDKPEYLRPWFNGKRELQIFLLAFALIQVPIMLLIKPIIKICTRPKIPQTDAPPNHSDEHEEHESNGDIFIHQAIHTIEYCLGSISHTASYLRLWALSLAHSQLSDVLWNMVMTIGFASVSGHGSNLIVCALKTYFSFAVWAVLTVAILIVMEGLSAFLHALRLHWVEFQSKFYHGNGYMFKPFHMKRIMAETNILAE